MENNIILVDTSILIDYYRKTDKLNSAWIALLKRGYSFSISAITKYEVYSGATESQLQFWSSIFHAIPVIGFDEASVDTAVKINSALKKKRKQIDIADLFIAATAVTHHLPLATLNRKHFDRIEALDIVN
ncbi:type II toxin-antitoxin system VapC family toxin [Segetibacter aerophilus]|uniref:Ribonuclease VapC n=1 Tax=Segetibacter aerophilus TaxID=670293 RepID=A0A512B8Q8_9BACT|nr:type II toxin-antitoxin system VapC family toxin [Segetibacter aerophilus]GEO08348.1 ribonuclease VapC [Segetibacter aerophilus]